MTLRDLSPLTSHLWQSTLCAAVVWLLVLALRKNRAAVRYGLWLAASVKFLIPFSWLIRAGAQVGWRTPPVMQEVPIPLMLQEISRPLALTPLPGWAVGASTGPRVFPEILLWGVWLCGFTIAVSAWYRWWRQIRAVRRAATPMDWKLPIPVMSSASRLEPGVFGIRRPVLLLPAGITERLTPSQLEAVLAHELCHVRRQDNLTGAIHMLVQAIFWFHPLVWWIGWRLLHERERACDEAVLGLGKEPEVYAGGILEACKYYLESPVACISGVTGADLKKRIESIMSNRMGKHMDLSRKLLLTAVSVVIVGAPLTVGLLHGQPRAEFEAASIKPSLLGFPDHFRPMPDGGVEGRYVSLKQLIQIAYQLKDFQIAGGPGWLDDDRFDILTKATGSPDRQRTLLMLRNLLLDRFKLTFHTETKEGPVYFLSVAKNGPKLQKPPKESRPGDGFIRWGSGYAHGQAAPIQQLAGTLAMQLHRIVIDKTELLGNFDFDLSFTPEGYKPPEETGARSNPNEPRPDPNGPSVFSALQEQLGLKLEGGKGPVETLVIDHAEKLTGN